MKFGQQATTLSGGEAQRVKLSKELSRRATGRTLYILDEPTTGLHFDDVEKAARSAARPGRPGQHDDRDRAQSRGGEDGRLGIDMGPEGGDGGGEVVAKGTPEDIARNHKSYTGAYLKPVLMRKSRSRQRAAE